jgi:hypothetical protein
MDSPYLEPYEKTLEEHWSKCCFCGAYNGGFGRPLEQHRPRCRYKGNADDRSVSTPNYRQMIAEDDQRWLPMKQDADRLPSLKARVLRLSAKLRSLEVSEEELEELLNGKKKK